MSGIRELIGVALEAALEAGAVIMEVYGMADRGIERKADNSPVTTADLRADAAISRILGTTGLPVLSEEGKDIPWVERRNWKRFWLVDPLDGTKEFISRNGEFTVNIALVEGTAPVGGVVLVPVSGVIYVGIRGAGAWKIDGAPDLLASDPYLFEKGVPLPAVRRNGYGIVASRSFKDERTDRFIVQFCNRYAGTRIVTRGSSLKLCMLAEGEADIYPRFGNISEWDTAAGHAIVVAAGGEVVKAPELSGPLNYNKKESLNPWFIAYRDRALLEEVRDMIPAK